MSDAVLIGASMVAAAAVLMLLYQRGGVRNGLFAVAAFFTFFSFGPVLNHLIGRPIYFGIVVPSIPQACVGFVLALIGILAADSLRPQRRQFSLARLDEHARYRYELLAPGLLLMSLYAAGMTVWRGASLLQATKQQALVLAGPGHRLYIFLAVCATALFFMARRSLLLRRLYVLHCITFVAYSLAFRERDFFFIFMVVILHRELFRPARNALPVLLGAAASVIAATFLFALRSGGGFGAGQLLNQGSILFVDSFLMSVSPEMVPRTYGSTYVDALLRLPPELVYSRETTSLPEWLVSIYNPDSTTGYGFSLSGEAYLNFGMAGIPVVFFVTALIHRFLTNRLDVSDWYAFASMYFTATWMYALRGDSLQLAKLMLYGAVVFLAIRVTSSGHRRRPAPISVSRVAAADARLGTPGTS